MPVLKLQTVTDRSREAEVGCARERLVNYLMTCEEDSLGKSELAEATQYQNHLSGGIPVASCWYASTVGIQEMKTISLH